MAARRHLGKLQRDRAVFLRQHGLLVFRVVEKYVAYYSINVIRERQWKHVRCKNAQNDAIEVLETGIKSGECTRKCLRACVREQGEYFEHHL